MSNRRKRNAPNPPSGVSTGSKSIVADTMTGSIAVTGDHNTITINGPDEEAIQRAKILREKYLHHVLFTAGQLSLSGIDKRATGLDADALDLKAVYTALMTLGSDTEESAKQGRLSGVEDFREARRLSAVEQLHRHGKLVLMGDPGGGKSTFLNFVALCLAGEGLNDPRIGLRSLTAPLPIDEQEAMRQGRKAKPRAQPWAHGALLPVRVVLRDFAARGLPPANEPGQAAHLRDFIIAELPLDLREYAAHLHNEMDETGALVMLDGLDEVPEAGQRREQIKQVVEAFSATHPHCRMLVTSRTYAYQKQEWRLRGFAEAVLAPFESLQINTFVDQWYAHVGQLRGMNQDDAQGRAELLKHAISRSDRLYALAERPLLLTLMAGLHAWRGGSLPERREELYREAVDLLLERWESPKVVCDKDGQRVVEQPSLAEWMKVDKEKVRAVLDDIAYQVHASQPDLTGAADVQENLIVTALLAANNNPDVRPLRLVEYIRDRAGLLLPHGDKVYTFPHRTFQEYLAACHLTGGDYPYTLTDLVLAEPQRWRETALLAAAKAASGSESSLWQFVEALLEHQELDHGLMSAVIAGQAIVETANLERISLRNKPKLEKVARWLIRAMTGAELPAIERAKAGELLVRIGDPRFDREMWCLPKGDLLGFVEIPAGTFWMGRDPEREPLAREDEQPQHRVWVERCLMAKYPVTVEQFTAYVKESGRAPKNMDSLRGSPNHPVVGVTWSEAIRYTVWLTERLKESPRTPEPLKTLLAKGDEQGRVWRVRLPSEVEWEKAARGWEDMRIYQPWGDEADPYLASNNAKRIGGTRNLWYKREVDEVTQYHPFTGGTRYAIRHHLSDELDGFRVVVSPIPSGPHPRPLSPLGERGD